MLRLFTQVEVSGACPRLPRVRHEKASLTDGRREHGTRLFRPPGKTGTPPESISPSSPPPSSYLWLYYSITNPANPANADMPLPPRPSKTQPAPSFTPSNKQISLALRSREKFGSFFAFFPGNSRIPKNALRRQHPFRATSPVIRRRHAIRGCSDILFPHSLPPRPFHATISHRSPSSPSPDHPSATSASLFGRFRSFSVVFGRFWSFLVGSGRFLTRVFRSKCALKS